MSDVIKEIEQEARALAVKIAGLDVPIDKRLRLAISSAACMTQIAAALVVLAQELSGDPLMHYPRSVQSVLEMIDAELHVQH
jgi:hypothetical protein